MNRTADTPEGPEVLARNRTELARDRTILATERTFSAWVRTGLAAMATGLGVVHLLDVPSMPWITLSMGSILVTLGGGTFVIAFYRYTRLLRKLSDGRHTTVLIWLSTALTALLLIAVVIALVLVFHSTR